jgi:hypothetical protein
MSINQKMEMSMKKIVIAATLVATVAASALAASANSYIDPRAPFDAGRFFNSLSSGQ